MAYVEGHSLREEIRRAREKEDVPRTRAAILARVALIEKVARALHAAHEAGVIHRDIKPANILIDLSGKPVVLDFGLACEAADGDDVGLKPGERYGTPAYMAPEQIVKNGPAADHRSDVYALGATLYEVLTLQRPFDAPSDERFTTGPRDDERVTATFCGT